MENNSDMVTLTFGGTTVQVLADGTQIEFADGTTVVGQPEDTDAYRHTAQTHGYGADTLSLCIEHEVMHVALADWLGVSDSPTMKAVRTNRLTDDLPFRTLEEAAVLAVQRYARAAGIDLVKRFAR
jgi:hypothetical protein